MFRDDLGKRPLDSSSARTCPIGVTTAHLAITDQAMPKFLFGQNELALQHMHKVAKEAVAEMA